MSPVFVPCENPEVLAEHQRLHKAVQYQANSTTWGADTVEGAVNFATDVDAGYRHRLVFADAAAAGQGLVDYRDRLGAEVEFKRPTDDVWLPSMAAVSALTVERNLRAGVAYRIVGSAPATPEPERPIDALREGMAAEIREAVPHLSAERAERVAAGVIEDVDQRAVKAEQDDWRAGIAQQMLASAAPATPEAPERPAEEGLTPKPMPTPDGARFGLWAYGNHAPLPTGWRLAETDLVLDWDPTHTGMGAGGDDYGGWVLASPQRLAGTAIDQDLAAAMEHVEHEHGPHDGRYVVSATTPCPTCGLPAAGAPAGEPRETPDDEPAETKGHRVLLAPEIEMVDHGFRDETWADRRIAALEAEVERLSALVPPPDAPPLPEGVEPVSWSPRFGCWVLPRADVPDGWGWTATDNLDLLEPHGTARPDDRWLVLARPAPVPEPPKTERVPWWEALSDRRTARGGYVLGERVQFTVRSAELLDDGSISLHGLDDDGLAIFPTADGTVEVLVREGKDQ